MSPAERFAMEAYLREWVANKQEWKRSMFLRFREYLVHGYSVAEIYTLCDGHYRREELAETLEARCWEAWFEEYFGIDRGNDGLAGKDEED